MKQLHRPTVFSWSEFNEDRNIDFHSHFYRAKQGNLLVDPLPLSDHDRRYILTLGGVQHAIMFEKARN